MHHQQKYPFYRYQPKRSNRRNSASSDSTPFPWSELKKCQKCGGRAVAQPSTPSASQHRAGSAETSPSEAFPRSIRTNTVQLPPPTPSSTLTPSTRYLPMMNNLSLNSPSRRIYPGHPMPSPSMPGELAGGPDAKRRRFDQNLVNNFRAGAARAPNGPDTPLSLIHI